MSHTTSLEEYIQICDFLASLIEHSFGPDGETALLLTRTGQAVVTTSGLGILEAAHCCHPVAKIILDVIVRQYQHTGDGSKSLLLLLREVFKTIKQAKHVNNLSIIDEKPLQVWLANCFTEILNVHLPQCFEEVRSSMFTQRLKFESQNANNLEKYCRILLRTFFSGKFSALIDEILSSLVEKFLFKSLLDWTKFYLFLQQSVIYFDVICTTIEGYSLEKSSLISGLVFNQTFTVVTDSCFEEKQKFIIINHSCKDECANEIVQISKTSELSSFLEWDQEYYEKFFKILQNHGITLILSATSVPDTVITFCYQYSVSLLTVVPAEELDYIVLKGKMLPLNSFGEVPSYQNIGMFEFIKRVQVEKHKYVIHVRLQESCSWINSHHILLLAPTKELSKQYFHECRNSLKILYHCIAMDDKCDKNTVCGNFLNSQNPLFSSTSFTTNISRRKEQIEIFKEGGKISCTKKNSDELSSEGLVLHGVRKFNMVKECLHNCDNVSNDIEGYCFPAGGWWELSLHHLLTNKNFISVTHDIKFALDIVAGALMVIPRTLHQNSHESHNSKFISIWQSMKKKLPWVSELGDGHFRTQNEVLWGNLEPVALKESVICHMLQLTIQLLRLDGTILNVHLSKENS